MIVCPCAVLTKSRVLAAAQVLEHEMLYRPVTAGRRFRALGARPQCGICYGPIRAVIAEAGLAFTRPEPLAGEAEDQPAHAATIAAA
jgi:bacterioferritin-associated ferredoxin